MQAVWQQGGIRDGTCRPKLAALAGFFASSSQYLAIAFAFTLPLSTSATMTLSILLPLCWLLSGDYAAKWQTIRQSRIVWVSIALFAVYALGVVHSTAPRGEAVGVLLKYRKLLYVPVFITVFACAWTRMHSLRCFQGAMLVTLGASLLMRFGLVQSRMGYPADCAVFKSHVTQNVLMAFFVAVLVQQAARNPRWRWLYVAVILVALYNIFFMVDGRTGYLVLFALLGLWMYRRAGWRGLASAAMLVTCLASVFYACSGEFRQRVDLVAEELADYYYVQRDSLDSSIGRRCSFYRTAAIIFLRHPVLGAGTGSFHGEFERLPENAGKAEVFHPHSEYFHALVQTGLVGLGVFLAWLVVAWRESHRLSPDMGLMAQTLIVTFAVGCLFNSFLVDTTEGYLYCYFLGFCYAEDFRRSSDLAADGSSGRDAVAGRRRCCRSTDVGRFASTASS